MLLLWHLGSPYLWQDEAATAVLAQRMLRFGRPLAYDGVNLITIDNFAAEDSTTIDRRTGNPGAAAEYYVRRGDYKPDTTWKWQPWGQFIIAAVSLKLLGATTLAARLPFALLAVGTVLVLYRFALDCFENWSIAFLAGIFLILNGYWVLHTRQCRYYAPSSFFLLLTIAMYFCWQMRRRWGAVAFVIAAWCWFQVDYGTIWPVLGVLFVDALLAERRRFWRPLLVGVVLAAAIAPFAYYYELWGRISIPMGTWAERFVRDTFNINEFILPVVLGLAALFLLKSKWHSLNSFGRRIVIMICAIFCVLLLWLPTVAPAAFLRYSIITAPLGCLVAAWVFVQVGNFRRAFMWVGAAIFIFTPWLSLPVHLLKPSTLRHVSIFRPELTVLYKQLMKQQPDPNRPVIEWLKQNAPPSAEILINYEDVPLMFYLPNPIRGGIAAFRVEDDSKRPPDFVVIRKSVDFVYWPAYQRELQKYQWIPVPVFAADIPCGNCPDPVQRYETSSSKSTFFARRAGP